MDPIDRSSNFEAAVNAHCPLQDGVHRVWQCKAFQKKSIDDRKKLRKEKILFLMSQW